MGFIYLLPIIGVLFLIITGFSAIMRSVLEVEKPKVFSYNHVNEKHKKIDFGIRIIFTIIILISIIYMYINPDTYQSNLSLIYIIFFSIFFIATETSRAFMEWKHAENPRAYIFTISQLIFALAFIWIISYFFLGII